MRNGDRFLLNPELKSLAPVAQPDSEAVQLRLPQEPRFLSEMTVSRDGMLGSMKSFS